MLEVKNPPTNAGDSGDTGSIPESGRPLGGGNGNPLRYPCQENPMDRGAWWATVHRLQRQTQLGTAQQQQQQQTLSWYSFIIESVTYLL